MNGASGHIRVPFLQSLGTELGPSSKFWPAGQIPEKERDGAGHY